jgi:glycerate kinase
MHQIILAPDSFKGALSASQFCQAAAEEIHTVFPHCQIRSIPIADGGEGTVDSFLLAAGGEKVFCPVTGPLFQPVEGFYGLLPDGKTAVMEMAAAAGLPLAAAAPNPEQTTTYGLGELIRHAVEQKGVRRILLGIGGSATNDGGCGMAAALGVLFLNDAGTSFVPTGGTLNQISAIDPAPARALLQSCSIQVLCDVNNPLFGPTGAACVFAPQKGADAEMVRRLDAGLRHYGALLEQLPGSAGVCTLPGGGAAGGLGAGLSALLDASLLPGIDLLLDAVSFDSLLPDCDLILTGEGRLDGQSLHGKAVLGICRRAKEYHVPVVALAGSIEGSETATYDQGLTAVFPINRQLLPLSDAMAKTEQNLRSAVGNLMRLLRDCRNQQK